MKIFVRILCAMALFISISCIHDEPADVEEVVTVGSRLPDFEATMNDGTISADESKVVYYSKTFKVQNRSITGTLQYRDKSTGNLVDVPYEAFVPFEMKPTYNRIGTVTIGHNGQFELRLRKEYKYDWTTDAVKFQFSDGSVVYEKEFASLNSLATSLALGAIILE